MSYSVKKKWADRSITDHTVYRREEADAIGLRYIPWREATARGQWLLTDDGYVAECAHTYLMKTNGVRMVKLVTASYAMTKGRVKLCIKRDRRKWIFNRLRRHHVQVAMDLYLDRLISGKGINWAEIGRIYDQSARIPAASFKIFVRQPEVKAYVKNELEKRFTHSGFTVESAIEEFKILMQMSKDKGNLEVLRDAVFKMTEMLEMVPDKRVTRFSYQQTMQLPAPEPLPDKEVQAMNKMLEAEYTSDPDA